jgi:hypothetical protein
MEATTVDNIMLSAVEFDAEADRKAQGVNNALMNIKLMHCELEAHMTNMQERFNALNWIYHSRPITDEDRAHRLSEEKRVLSQIASWHKGAMWSVWASEYTFHNRPGQKLHGYRAETAKQCERLFKMFARVIHQLQQAHPSSDRDVERLMAEYAVYLAHATAFAVGPIGDLRYRHPDKPKWARIKARALEHMRILVQKDITDGVDGTEGVERNKKLAADLKRAALAARTLAAQGDEEQLSFAA